MPVSTPGYLKPAVIFGEGSVKPCYPCTIKAVFTPPYAHHWKAL